MASELREIMRELRVTQPSRSVVRVAPPTVRARLFWDDLGRLGGTGEAHCHPRDTFDREIGIEIAYGRAVKDAAQRLLDDFVGEPPPAGTKTLGDYIPCDEQEAFALDREDHSGDDGLLEDLSTWDGDVAEKLAELDSRIVDLECNSFDHTKDLSRRISELLMRTSVQAWRLQDELDHLEERLAELEAGDGRRD